MWQGLESGQQTLDIVEFGVEKKRDVSLEFIDIVLFGQITTRKPLKLIKFHYINYQSKL
jgi:hypothetical protein